MNDNDKIKILQSIRYDLFILKEIKSVFDSNKVMRKDLQTILSNPVVMTNIIIAIYELINDNKLNIEENKNE